MNQSKQTVSVCRMYRILAAEYTSHWGMHNNKIILHYSIIAICEELHVCILKNTFCPKFNFECKKANSISFSHRSNPPISVLSAIILCSI